MSLLDGYTEEKTQNNINNKKKKSITPIENSSSSLLDGYEEQPEEKQQTFSEAHPFVSSLPQAAKQLGIRAVKSYPDFAKGLNDLVALTGDLGQRAYNNVKDNNIYNGLTKYTLSGKALDGLLKNSSNISEFGRDNAEFWQEKSDKIQIDPKYQGLKGLKNKGTIIPTIAGEVGGQATNLLMALGGGAAGGIASKAAGASKLGQAAIVTAGSALPNLAQEGQYLEKVEQFKSIYGREPSQKELQNIQNVAFGEKSINTVLETVADRLLFGKMFPKGSSAKSLKKIGKDILEQTVTEAGTEGLQESVSIGAEKLLGLNNDSFIDNLGRVGEASVLGGITGGVLGGTTSSLSRNYDTQFPDSNNNATTDEIKDVSAKLFSGGNELYNSVANGIGNAISSINQPTAFDTLRELSKNGDFQNTLQTIAPNTMQKVQEEINNSSDVGVENTGMPNLMAENENLYNLQNNGEREIVNEKNVQEIAKDIQEKSNNEVNAAALEKPKTEIEKKIEEIAPKTTENTSEKNNTKSTVKENINSNVTEEYQKIKEIAPNTIEKQQIGQKAKNQELVKKIAAEGFDETIVNEHIRKLENAEELGTDNMLHVMQSRLYKAREKGLNNTFDELESLYQSYRKKRKEKLANLNANQTNNSQKLTPQNKTKQQKVKNKKGENYLPKKKQEAYDILSLATGKKVAWLKMQKNKSLEKIENLIDKVGDKLATDYFSEYYPEINKLADDNSNESIGVAEKIARQVLDDIINDNFYSLDMYSDEDTIALIKNEMEIIKDKIKTPFIKELANSKITDESFIKAYNKLEKLSDNLSDEEINTYMQDMEAFESIYNLQQYLQEEDNTLESPNKEIYNNNEVENDKNGRNQRNETENIQSDRNREVSESLQGEVFQRHSDKNVNNTPQENKTSEDTSTNAGNVRQDNEKSTKRNKKTLSNKVQKKEIINEKIAKIAPNTHNKLNNKELDNGNVETVNENRSELSEKQKEKSSGTSGISQKESSNDGYTNGIRRDNNISDERGIIEKHREIISNKYKNQYELNQAIENFINNNEIEVYKSVPEEIKDWLKKYTGAGGLEKQGAEGKGLLSEYYTPHNIVKKMWDLVKQYVNTDGAKVLEPSVGIGRFLENAPQNTNFDVVEMNPVSAKITKILYPDANVTTGEFQEKFINKNTNTPVKSVSPEYDIVIGNPPYGAYSGRYKGLGEGKNIARLEHYFIKRGLDTLKENGVLVYIIPSSFLDGSITKVKQEISAQAEILDAYRLPENSFDTTSIGTDIIVLRKRKMIGNSSLFNAGNWFKQNPEKVLGTIETRKNRFGKEETYVKGDKNLVNNIDTTKKDIKEVVATKKITTTTTKTNTKTIKKTTSKNVIKGNIEYNEYVPEIVVTDKELELFNDTRVDGTLPKEKYKPNKYVNQYNGELYNDFNYLQGDIYEKLDQLANENITDEQKEVQRKKLLNVLPEVKTVNEIAFNPTSDFIREFNTDVVEETEHWDYNTRTNIKKFENVPLDKMYLKYAEKLTRSERDDVTISNIREFVRGERIRIDYNYPAGMYDDKARESYRKQKSAEILSKIKNVVDKTFNDFVRNELSQEQKEKLADLWNRNFNAIYNPDYTKMPMIVKGLNSEFNGKKLVLQNVQIEGVNFLTNKGVGLLGFEVGVGKTLTGIISTVQNMQMGRCKRPLILVPKQVKNNWIKEINQAFPNIKVNDVDNMSKFKGEIPENSLTVATYEALGNIWYGDLSNEKLTNIVYEIGQDISRFDNSSSDTDRRDSTKRAKEKVRERAEKLVGLAEKGNKKLFNIQDLGFDHITVDEAHNFKNLFADAKADGQEGNAYTNITGGTTSSRATRLFLFAQYILNNNNNRNVFMLTATPFNNSPLEVFNMLSFIAKDKLDKMGLYNVYQFMENYADINSDWIVNSRNEVEYKQVVTAFKNASSLRELIKSVMMIRSAEDAGIVRPEKFTKRVVLEPSEKQLEQIRQAEEDAVKGGKDDGAVLKAINQSRKSTLSPDIAADNFEVTPTDLINNSPKLSYIMNAVESMKKKDPKTSQLIYMPLGVKFLPKIKEYLVNKGIFKDDEIGIIESGVSDDKIDKITESFNDRDGKVKLIIGTNKIKEGMNLNKNSSVLYVPYMDWNPTDFVQIVGRIWRRGNRYSKIRVVVPLLKNSSDSFMFQKLNEKTDRINNIMDESKEYINTSELNTAEEKINMISNPDKKVKMFIRVEKQKLEAQKSSLEGRLDMVRSYKEELSGNERMIQYSKEKVEETEKALSEIDPIVNEWNYNRTQDRLKNYKKDIPKYTYALKKIKEKIKRLELDFNGKDSDEAILAEIEKVDEQIKNVEELSKKKLEEYTQQYEEERKNSKSIKELIKEFEEESYALYPDENNKSEDSKPLNVEPKKKYERTRENAYNIPVIKLETQAQRNKKEKTKNLVQKAKEIVSAKQYNKKLKEGIAKWSSEINIRRYEADRTLNAFINITKTISKQIGVNDKHLREIMPFLRERTEFPEELNRPELKRVWDKINQSATLKDNLTKLADSLSEKFEKFWTEYKAVQASGDFETNEDEVKNYITHIWDLDQKKQGLLTTYFATKSRFAKQRKIDTLYNGIQGITLENGETLKLKPKVLDYAEILKIQSDNLIKATVDKVFADSVKSFKTAEGASLVLPSSKAPNNWIEINNSALNKTVAKPVSTTFGEKISPVLVNKLAEIGIAIGNRLSKYKANGIPNSLGKFVKNQPPEIRLQRWFSTKTLAHEVGHAMDEILGLSKDGFVDRYRDELLELNKERIEAFEKNNDRQYAEKDSELIAELFGVMFNDVESAFKYAPAATSEIMNKMTKNKKLEQLLPGNFDWTEAKHVLEEKVVEFFRMPVKVHPDIAATLKTVFENKKEYLDVLGFKPGKALDDVNAIAKMFNFSLSGFHGWALSESYLGNVGVKGLKDVINFKKIYDSVKNNDYDIYKKEETAKQAIKDGLQIGATLDVQRGIAENLINNIGKFLENSIPGFGKPFSMPVKVIAKATELNNKVLWDVIHNNYKINAYEFLIQNESKNGNITEEKRKEIAQWVNDSFGGLAWENLGINSSTKKTFSRWLMSPDWLLSSTRQFMGMFSSKVGHKALNSLASKSEFWNKVKDTTQFFGINSLTDDIEASGMRGRIARNFWARAAIQSIIYMNLLNALFRAWDRDKNPDLYPKEMTPLDYSMINNSKGSKTNVFIGRNKDGSERYARFGKQFREMPELIEDPIKHIGAKIAPIPQSISTVFTGRSMSGFENKEMAQAKGWQRIGVASKQLAKTFLPFSIGSAIQKGSDYSVFDLVATTGKGMTKYKAKQEFKSALKHGNKPNVISDIKRSMVMNGMSDKDINKVYKTAKSEYTKKFKEDYIQALTNKDKEKITKINAKIIKNNLSKVEQREIYSKALKEFYSKRNINK